MKFEVLGGVSRSGGFWGGEGVYLKRSWFSPWLPLELVNFWGCWEVSGFGGIWETRGGFGWNLLVVKDGCIENFARDSPVLGHGSH